MSDYSFTVDVPVRFCDLDTMGHVNNAVYATLLEEARAAYVREVLDVPLGQIDSVLASLHLDFRRPVESAGEVTVAVRVPELGESSIPMEYEVRDGGTVAAAGETIQVIIDRETNSSRPIPEPWREKLCEFEGL